MAEISEIELEDYLMKHLETDFYFADGDLLLEGKAFRQFRIDGYGIIDILIAKLIPKTNTINFTIVELKKNSLTYNCIGQIARYQVGLKELITEWQTNLNTWPRIKYNIELILIGRRFDASNDACYIGESIKNLSCYHYDLDLGHGIEFNKDYGWHKTDTDFSKHNDIGLEIARNSLSARKKYVSTELGFSK